MIPTTQYIKPNTTAKIIERALWVVIIGSTLFAIVVVMLREYESTP